VAVDNFLKRSLPTWSPKFKSNGSRLSNRATEASLSDRSKTPGLDTTDTSSNTSSLAEERRLRHKAEQERDSYKTQLEKNASGSEKVQLDTELLKTMKDSLNLLRQRFFTL
jgi:hypothetical protein